ncbi:transglutaminase superfamily protein [Allofrancisella inopinata]|uniref:Lasso peptide biosynthesis B2 protein n=1 Tax=Allofrancisella inopinata TaxID=1085647 RepID=A0AAE6YGZ7_9GAMM|nr:lasso peptide biosynthesis B2 protein [Allofrancisella inopinata]QIV95585.1 lasso peptide biosynthesis B2 protein [Allofrancisella inopinata]TDT70726.1 transglutaminase superfamily protein [Allofrancisella inopinata]
MIAKKILRKLLTAFKMPLKRKIWFIILYPISGVARFASLTLSLKKIFWYLGYMYENKELCIPANEQQIIIAYKISKTATLVSKYVPWESKCLIEAIMVKTLLKYYKIPYVIHIGIKKYNQEEKPFLAHAWVKVGDKVVIGGDGHGCKSYNISCTITSIEFKTTI